LEQAGCDQSRSLVPFMKRLIREANLPRKSRRPRKALRGFRNEKTPFAAAFRSMRPANTGNYYLGWPVSVSTSPIREFHSPLSVSRIADLELNCCRHYASTRQCTIQVRCTTLQRVSRFSARACTSRLCTATNFSFRAEIIRGCRE